MEVSKSPLKVILFSARRTIFFLSHLSTQGSLSISSAVMRSIRKIDQSWLEAGQINLVKVKRSNLFPVIVISSFSMVLTIVGVVYFFT